MSEMSLKTAQRIAAAARAKAQELSTPITVSVVDDDGRLILCERGDGTGFLTPETSRGKAVAAAAFRRATKELVDLAREHPAFWNAIPGLVPGQLLASTGAVPITKDGRVIGAIGCGGGTGEQDHQCALAGAATV
jgi:glc operon protein GlcG